MRMQQTCGQIGKPHSSKHEQGLQPRCRDLRGMRLRVMELVLFRGLAFMILMRLMRLMGTAVAGVIM